jgi:hypothetical protein
MHRGLIAVSPATNRSHDSNSTTPNAARCAASVGFMLVLAKRRPEEESDDRGRTEAGMSERWKIEFDKWFVDAALSSSHRDEQMFWAGWNASARFAQTLVCSCERCGVGGCEMAIHRFVECERFEP